jgi:hypothetical protein
MDPKNLKKIIALQSLMKARLEMEISRLAATLVEIEMENGELMAMLDRRYEGQAAFVDPAAILTRISTNMGRRAQLEKDLAAGRQELLQTSRRAGMLEERMTESRQAAERKELTQVIEEFRLKPAVSLKF